MPVDKDTPIGSFPPAYRKTLITALGTMTRAIAKARKSAEQAGGDTLQWDEKDEIVEDLKGCLGARTETSLADTPIGRAMDEGKKKHKRGEIDDQMELDQLEPSGVDLMDDAVIIMMLDLARYREEPDDIAKHVATWKRETRRAVYRWARAMQLAGSPGVTIKVPRKPADVKKSWLEHIIVEQIEAGKLEPEAQSPTDGFSDEEIMDHVMKGPWAPARVEGSEDVWTLRYNAPEGHTGELPTYEFTHAGEAPALRIAARINFLLAGGQVSTSSDVPPEQTGHPAEGDANEPPVPPADAEDVKGKKRKRLEHRKAAPRDPKAPRTNAKKRR